MTLAAGLARAGALLDTLERRAATVSPPALFVASALFTFLRNTQDGILWDLSYILNTATRIAAGDVPYAQFPLAHAPLTFVNQAFLIRLFGPHFIVPIVYVSLAGGLATALTWRIVRRMLDGAVSRASVLATILCLPLVPLGISAVYPHPFYDPDTCLAMLIALSVLLAARARPTPRRLLAAGALLVVPTFFKQNIGLMFLALTLGTLALEAAVAPSRRGAAVRCAVGAVAALATACVVIQLVVGLGTYLQWTIGYAAGARPIALDKIAPLVDLRRSGLYVVGLALAILAARALPPRARPFVLLAGLGVPFILRGIAPWSAAAVLEWWPPLLALATIGALVSVLRGRIRVESLLGGLAAGVAAATFLSNGLTGSTYGVFPLLVMATASLVVAIGAPSGGGFSRAGAVLGVVVAACLLVAGGSYTLSNRYNLWHTAGVPVRAAYPSLSGLAAPGPYLRDLDAALVWIEANVPPDEPAVFIPGEDPIYYALGRRPPLPVVMFEGVTNPYSAEELVALGRSAGLRWVFVKEGPLQLGSYDERALIAAFAPPLTRGLVDVGMVGAYHVYRSP